MQGWVGVHWLRYYSLYIHNKSWFHYYAHWKAFYFMCIKIWQPENFPTLENPEHFFTIPPTQCERNENLEICWICYCVCGRDLLCVSLISSGDILFIPPDNEIRFNLMPKWSFFYILKTRSQGVSRQFWRDVKYLGL